MTVISRHVEPSVAKSPTWALGTVQLAGTGNIFVNHVLATDARRVVAFQYLPQDIDPAAPTLAIPGLPSWKATGKTIIRARSPVLPAIPVGAVTDLGGVYDLAKPWGTNTFVWVIGDDGTLMELHPTTLELLAVYGVETFGVELTPMRFVGYQGRAMQPFNRHIFLQGSPGELLAWNTGTKKVDHRIATGMGALSSTMNTPVQTAGLLSIRDTTTLRPAAGTTVLNTTDWQTWDPVQPASYREEGFTKLWRNGIEVPQQYPLGTAPAAGYWTRGPGYNQITLGTPSAEGDTYVFTCFNTHDICVASNDRGKIGFFSYSRLFGWRKLSVQSCPEVTGVLGAIPGFGQSVTGPGAGIIYLAQRAGGLRRLVQVQYTDKSIVFSPGPGLTQPPGVQAPILAVTEYPAEQGVEGMTERPPSNSGFRLVQSKQLPGQFKALPVAIQQVSGHTTARHSSIDRRWVIPCADGAFWYYSEETT